MIQCDNLVKIYKTAELEVVALQGLDLRVAPGELMAIIGNSGSGKSTLLNMLGGLDRPSAGKLRVDGQDLLQFGEREMKRYKRNTVGFVWQNNARNLIPYLTARENVELPMLLRGKRMRAFAVELLEAVGLKARLNNRLSELSGGEQQRVAIAIALANQPKLLLADEPTGSVDTRTSVQILDFFREINRNYGVTVVIVTHDQSLARQVDRVVAIRDGKISSEMLRRRSYAEEMRALDETMRHETAAAKRDATAEGEAANASLVVDPNVVGQADEDSHIEYAILDQAGRMQVPRHILEQLGVQDNKLIIAREEDGRIVLRSSQQEKG